MTNSDVKVAYRAILAKRRAYNGLWKYYKGDQPLVYSVDLLEEVFKRAGTTFNENWCAVVVDSLLERLQMTRLTVTDSDEMTTVLQTMMTATELDLEEDSIHLATLVCGEAFLIAWLDANGNPEAYYNDPRLIHLEYDADNPHKKKWAAKMWSDHERWYMTLYYHDKIEKYMTKSLEAQEDKAFVLMEEEGVENPVANPYGVIPVFHFRRVRHEIVSEIHNVTPIQDGINKLIADLMVAGEFGAFKQRWVISNSDTTNLKNNPNAVWEIPAASSDTQGTSVGQFDATDLSNFIDAIKAKVGSVSAISRTPHHFFFGTGQVPSGEALIALESPLNKKATRMASILGRTWQQVARFLFQLQGIEVPAELILPVWERPQTVQPKTEAEIRQISVSSGMPLVTVLRMQGWTEEQIDEMERDKSAETAAQNNSLAKALMAQQRAFDKNVGGDDNGDEVEEDNDENDETGGK